MYWPTGAPRIYAATKHVKREQRKVSQDGLDSAIEEDEAQNGQRGEGGSQNGTNSRDQGGDRKRRARSEDTIRPGDLNGKHDAAEDGKEFETESDVIMDLAVSRSGSSFVSITETSLSVWQTKPTVVVASIERSRQSLDHHGICKSVHFRPDASIALVETSLGFLIAYDIGIDPAAQIYRTIYPEHGGGHARHKSLSGQNRNGEDPHWGPGEGNGVREVGITFRTSYHVDSSISKVLALDDEIMVATANTAAIQCIPWQMEESTEKPSVESLDRLAWIADGAHLADMVFDRPMNLSTWVTSDGRAYAVQRTRPRKQSNASIQSRSFQGYCFHTPSSEAERAIKATINARFSLITVACANGNISVYNAKDYTGNIVLSHKHSPPPAASGSHGCITSIRYSPDGYCLFAGYEHGWAMWSVYGKPSANSFSADRSLSETTLESWLLGVQYGFWLGGGSQLLLHNANTNEMWVVDMARSALVGCFSSANVSRSLLQTNSGIMVYCGHDTARSIGLSSETGSWQNVPIPSSYLAHHWPIRSTVISGDGRYVAVAGRRGLAHYSVNSGRWKTFDDADAESDFTVRGGMCWHQHVLIAAVETSYDTHELRVYSRETALTGGAPMHTAQLQSPVVILTPTGLDSLLVYTYGNVLLHYIINVNNTSVKLVQVGQIALHGIVRAPPRVRALSWILPEEQLDNGDPSQDVALATIIFLVDGKLVSLQPATKETGELKYEMRIIAQNVEYYALMRERLNFSPLAQSVVNGATISPPEVPEVPLYYQNDLRDSLWYFDGTDMRVWTDVQDLLASASPELARELPEAVKIPVDFYPLAPVLEKGVLFGVEAEVVQRRDTSFAFLRHVTRTHLFLPPVLRYHIGQYNTPSALYLSHRYQHLPYFAHALEVLLHDVLDEEVDRPAPAEQALLPSVLSFISSFTFFLDILLQCTRKTEVRSWRTLFAHLPSPQELFQQSIEKGDLKTAGGYLLVLHTLEDEAGARSSSRQVVELLKRAKDEGEWELCKELARFLRALDEDGSTLQRALEDVGLASPQKGFASRTSRLSVSGRSPTITNGIKQLQSHQQNGDEYEKDYFS